MREHMLTADDLIYPVFVLEGGARGGCAFYAGREASEFGQAAVYGGRGGELGIPMLALFPWLRQTKPGVRRRRTIPKDSCRQLSEPCARGFPNWAL